MIHQCLFHKIDIALPPELLSLVGRFFVMSRECYFVKMMFSVVSLFKCKKEKTIFKILLVKYLKCLKCSILKKNFMAPFYGWGSTASRLEPL